MVDRRLRLLARTHQATTTSTLHYERKIVIGRSALPVDVVSVAVHLPLSTYRLSDKTRFQQCLVKRRAS
jgi:hypothetical protein